MLLDPVSSADDDKSRSLARTGSNKDDNESTTMGKGGQSVKTLSSSGQATTTRTTTVDKTIVKQLASPPTSSNTNSTEEWKSPFTPDKIDPRVAGKSISEINAAFPTKSELRAVIPPHCFTRPLHWSFFYVGCDILQGVAIWYLTCHVIQLPVDPPGPIWTWQWWAWRAAWNIYGVVMGYAIGGLWCIGHECGHGAFSDYPVVNGTVGWICHSALLVPYFSWAFSHAKHHRRTNDMVHGETHIPPLYNEFGMEKQTDGTYKRLPEEVVDAQVAIFGEGGPTQGVLSHCFAGHASIHEDWGDEAFAGFMVWTRLYFGWQAYLAGIISGGKLGADQKPIAKDEFPDHFRPHSRLFPPKMYTKVLFSDFGILLTVAALVYASTVYSFRAVWFYYFGPYMTVHAFLVTVTWLQHTHESVPHFDLENWSWMKASLAGTIDRPLYGWMNWCSHNIVTTHIVHHVFHEIPHYHAVEATLAVRAYLEPKGLYNYDDTDALMALWKVCKTCHFMDADDDGVQYYRKLKDVPLLYTNTTEESSKEAETMAKKND
ncbi:Delta(12) acyl-lipid conjugase (11E,13E-forming) [Seminavis robusta]|uniref:Delta(12) acyl-lipid conjugase (11E,13E-forming) n=1 Tax=Seminavis robusta TaxID=568900 RepID=A0A9N8ETY1_9STRA|nr:Delta(12) acyl-lipid conjugase (11E,13E-forming) [Seminavis robusta]|eukprot:Sro2149_g316610.1 Delta(12) acyl-lipid conjugase (11E,13E-forming) (544) ;mRNA; f:6668-8416